MLPFSSMIEITIFGSNEALNCWFLKTKIKYKLPPINGIIRASSSTTTGKSSALLVALIKCYFTDKWVQFRRFIYRKPDVEHLNESLILIMGPKSSMQYSISHKRSPRLGAY